MTKPQRFWYHSRTPISRKIVLTGTFAALYTVFRLIPIDKALGISGTITAGGVIIPLIALFLDPPFAVASVVIGTFVSSFAPWNPLRFLGLDFLPGTAYVGVVSLVLRGKRGLASLIYLATIITFIATPYTVTFVGSNLASPPIPYYWLHIVAFFVLLSPLSTNLLQKLDSENYLSVATGIATLALVGTMIEHLAGGILFALVSQAGALRFWPIIFLVYPVERTLIVIIATLAGVPVVMATQKFRRQMFKEELAGALLSRP